MADRSGAAAVSVSDRIDRLPRWGLGRAFFVLLGASYFFAFYDITAIGVSMGPMLDDLHLHEAQSSWPVTGNLIAYIVGSYVFGNVADLLGRRRALRLSLVVLAVGSLLTAFSWDLASVTVFRIITGVGTGAQISIAATIASEFAATPKRGRYVAMNAVWGGLGFAITPFVGIALLPLDHVGWRILFAIGALSVLVLPFCTDRWIPESPRWLARVGRTQEAEAVVARMEEGARRRFGRPLPEPVPSPTVAVAGSRFPTRRLLQRGLVSRLALVFAFWFLWYLWIYGYLGYGPTILGKMGHSLPDALWASGVGNLGFLVGGAVAPFLVDRIERKLVIVAGALCAGLGFLLCAASGSMAATMAGMLLIGFGNFAPISSAYTYTGEIFPTEARGSAMAIGDGLGHIGGAVAPYVVLPLLDGQGPRVTLVGLAIATGISALVMSFGVRTKQRTLGDLVSSAVARPVPSAASASAGPQAPAAEALSPAVPAPRGSSYTADRPAPSRARSRRSR